MTPVDTVRDALELAQGMVTQDADAQVRFENGRWALDEITREARIALTDLESDDIEDAIRRLRSIVGTGALRRDPQSLDVGAQP